MTERIKELAEQAGYKDFEYAIIAHKFAELIIKDCIVAVEQMDTMKGATTYDKDLVDSVKHHCAQAIERKFK
jgi:hypothetical protein